MKIFVLLKVCLEICKQTGGVCASGRQSAPAARSARRAPAAHALRAREQNNNNNNVDDSWPVSGLPFAIASSVQADRLIYIHVKQAYQQHADTMSLRN